MAGVTAVAQAEAIAIETDARIARAITRMATLTDKPIARITAELFTGGIRSCVPFP